MLTNNEVEIILNGNPMARGVYNFCNRLAVIEVQQNTGHHLNLSGDVQFCKLEATKKR